jgi:hypothetical protein
MREMKIGIWEEIKGKKIPSKRKVVFCILHAWEPRCHPHGNPFTWIGRCFLIHLRHIYYLKASFSILIKLILANRYNVQVIGEDSCPSYILSRSLPHVNPSPLLYSLVSTHNYKSVFARKEMDTKYSIWSNPCCIFDLQLSIFQIRWITTS